jgi:hypothetical protein
MLAFTEGVLDTMACPFFGDGCAKVGRSPHVRELGVPHAAIGVLGYALMTLLALSEGGAPRRDGAGSRAPCWARPAPPLSPAPS